MQWLNLLVEDIISRFPEGDLIIESGASPSGTYHFGHLREVTLCDAIVMSLGDHKRHARHIHFVDDLDGLRKIPTNVSERFEQYLGMPLCDVPAPDGSDKSYASYFLGDLIESMEYLGIDVEIIYSHEQYEQGFFVNAIEKSIENAQVIKEIIQRVSQRSLDESWNPIQVMESGRLKNRKIVKLDKLNKLIIYIDDIDHEKSVSYSSRDVKLDWRLDWPARWSLLNVNAEPFGRDHATTGGSYDTGSEIAKLVFNHEPPSPVPYDFINRSGDNKKMSASSGTGINVAEIIKILPPEIIRYFILRFPPEKRLYFDPVDGVVRLVDEYAELAAKNDRSTDEDMLLRICSKGLDYKTVSQVPFSHLVTGYQAALKNVEKTLEVISRSEYNDIANTEKDIIKSELKFIDEWLNRWAPDSIKFELLETFDGNKINATVKQYLKDLSLKIEQAPANADGNWFHNAIYELKDTSGLSLQEMFNNLYIVLIGKSSGPRAGWFLSLIPRNWLIKRLRLEG